MAKRSAEERKEPTKRPHTIQPTMFKFFQPGQGSSSLQKPCVAEETPQSYGIHTYSEAEIGNAPSHLPEDLFNISSVHPQDLINIPKDLYNISSVHPQDLIDISVSTLRT